MTSQRPYDLAVAYRIYPKIAKCALPLPFGADKYRLSKACLQSFRESLGPLRVKVWALLDNCPKQYEEHFFEYFHAPDLVILNLNGEGNQATFARQINILLNQTDADLVYFAEDDYLYLPGQFPPMVEFMVQNSDVDFVSPFDHRDYYTLISIIFPTGFALMPRTIGEPWPLRA